MFTALFGVGPPMRPVANWADHLCDAVEDEIVLGCVREAVLDVDCDLPSGFELAAIEEPARALFREQYPKFRTQFVQEHITPLGTETATPESAAPSGLPPASQRINRTSSARGVYPPSQGACSQGAWQQMHRDPLWICQ